MNQALQVWSLGLLNSGSKKFLSQETIGDQLNASAALFRHKQTFTLEQEGDISHVSIKTPRGGYVHAGPKGELRGTAADKSDETTFTVEVQADGTWAFKSKHGYYLSAEKESECACFARAVTPAECFAVQLAIHPQVCIFSPARNAYAHLEDGELRANEVVPWGYDAMVTLLFVKQRAKYALRAANGKFWSCSAALQDQLDDNCLYVLAIAEGGKIGFRGNNGKYLTAPTSANSVMKCTGASVGANESFVLEDSHGQVSIQASNGKYASISQNEDPQIVCKGPVTDKEIYQMETNGTGWTFRTNGNRYWSVKDGNVCTSDKAAATYFDLTYEGKNVIIGHAGKVVTYKPQGGMLCNSSDASADNAKFNFDLINRPQLVVRSDFGFVTCARSVVACNAAEVDTFFLQSKGGAVTLQGPNGFFVLKDDCSIAANGSSGDEFHLEWLAHTKFAIRAAKNNMYVVGGQQGQFKATSTTAGPNVPGTLWEY